MHNIKLIIAYDGGAYLGWQKTNMGPSIEQTLQKAIEKNLQHPVVLQAASRTDAGVHANEQVVNFFSSKSQIDLHRLKFSLNQLLPKDIVVLSSEFAPSFFHPTLDCQYKEYRYYICTGSIQLPIHRFYSWHIYQPLDLQKIQHALPYFIGKKCFAAFSNSKNIPQNINQTREIIKMECLELENHRLCFKIEGKSFLRNMVRIIVGTLIDIGKEKISPDNISGIFESKKRNKAGLTAPAHGLFLHRIIY